jgi:hypothetical protein
VKISHYAVRSHFYGVKKHFYKVKTYFYGMKKTSTARERVAAARDRFAARRDEIVIVWNREACGRRMRLSRVLTRHGAGFVSAGGCLSCHSLFCLSREWPLYFPLDGAGRAVR